MRKYLIFTILALVMCLAGAQVAQAATEFVSTVKQSGGDYSMLNTWAAAFNASDLTANTTRVLSHSGKTGTISDGNYVKGAVSGAYGTVIHCTSTQIAIQGITGTFASGEKIDKTPTLNGTPTGTDYVTSCSAPDSLIAVALIDGAWSSADATAVTLSGTSSSANYFKITTAPAAWHQGSYDTAKYRLEPASNATALTVNTGFARIEGLQITVAASASGAKAIALTNSVPDGGVINISRCVIVGAVTSTSGIAGIDSASIGAGSRTLNIFNNVIYNFISGSNANYGVRADAGWVIYAYNNTAYNCYYGFYNAVSPAFVAKNNIANACAANGYSGTFDPSSTNNISNTADAPGANPLNSTAVTFVNAAGNDLHIASGDTAAKNAGADLSADANIAFSVDVDSQKRPIGAWDRGADEYVVVGPATKLAFIQQPSASVPAGVVFGRAPWIAVEDASDNIVTTDNLTQITLSRGATGTDVLQGTTLTLPVTAGIATFSGLSYNKAETMNILATAEANTSSGSLKLNIYNVGTYYMDDDKYISVKSTNSQVYVGGSGDGWASQESGNFTLS